MAAAKPAMSPPAGAEAFLAAHGWARAHIAPLAGDASFRRYFRVTEGARRAVLMDAPPAHEDVSPFLAIAAHLDGLGLSAPQPLALDAGQGLLLLEDFGDDLVRPLLARAPEHEAGVYRDAVDILALIGRAALPPALAPYDMAAMLREVALFADWYAPATGLAIDREAFLTMWAEALAPIADRAAAAPVLVLRDYHAENLMLLAREGLRRIGLLDFQDALAGHPLYDLASLIHDARRDVPEDAQAAAVARWHAAHPDWDADALRRELNLLSAQRNVKILGIFTRLWVRDGKPGYRAFQPRVWGYLERALNACGAPAPRRWFDANVPPERRAAFWIDPPA